MVSEEQILLGVASDRRPVPLIGADLLRHLLRHFVKNGFLLGFSYTIYYAILGKKQLQCTMIRENPFPVKRNAVQRFSFKNDISMFV